MSYIVILATVAFSLWLIVERFSWITFLITSIPLFYLTVLSTNFCFPFWRLYSSQWGVVVIFIGLPITLLNVVALNKLANLFKKKRSWRKQYMFIFAFVLSGFLFFGIGFIHSIYQSIPINNLNLYLKQREYIVDRIKAGTLHGESRCMQNFRLYEGESPLDRCSEEIELPEEYKALSRNGKVHLTKSSEQLSVSFTHSTYNFGDGSIKIVYSSLDNNLSKPTWAINPPPIPNR